MILGIALCLAIADITAPPIFRPTILIFLLAGLACALHKIELARLSVPRVALPTFICAAGLAVVFYRYAEAGMLDGVQVFGESAGKIVRRIGNIFKRVSLVFAVLFATRQIGISALHSIFLRLEPGMFVAYLAHVPFFGVVWFVWQRVVGSEQALAYVVFFLGLPVLGVIVGQLVDHLIRRMPRMIQLPLRGREFGGVKTRAVA